ncbi:MAG: DNA repair protein RadC [Tannerella sp.]|jgi:DNA repair protein RadC|nr:DNA repair protein RadC [Tannerella sp.]
MDSAGRLRIKEWAVEDRPREKMLLKGTSSLSDAELLAILIGSGNTRETAVQLSQRILNSVSNNLNALGKMSLKELTAFNGIGEAKAVTVLAAMELGRRRDGSEPRPGESIRTSAQVFKLFHPQLRDLPHEEFWIATTDRAGKVIEKVKISQGGTGTAGVDIRMILKTAVNTLCSGLLLCHNHPSGNLHPSRQDDALTSSVQQAAKLLNIQLLDHIILCDNKFYSYADEGRL